MDINDAEKFVYAWGMWERGRSDGIALAIQMVERRLCGEGMVEGQRLRALASKSGAGRRRSWRASSTSPVPAWPTSKPGDKGSP